MASRQPTTTARIGISAAPSAPPKGRPTCFNPMTVARWAGGNHANMAVINKAMSVAYEPAALAANNPAAITTWPRISVRLMPQ